MLKSSVQFSWRDPDPTSAFRTAVSLHGHTMHSQECLNFLPRYLRRVPGLSLALRHYRRIDFARAWWTPPLTPAAALSLERQQIADMGLQPVVSLTDHDDIEAGLSLSVAADPDLTPISVEWTVPYARSIFHIGVHNIPRSAAAEWMAAMAGYTAAPRESALPAILDEFARNPSVLIVLNHPFWIEEGVIEADHGPALRRLLRECLGWLDAFELNGTRPWKENSDTIDLARESMRPVIAGGDRHGCEASACINLTNAQSFTEFVTEIHAGRSSVLFLPQYREPLTQRVLEAIRDILGNYPEYPDRERWSDRVFYRGDDGVARSVSTICRGEPRFLGAVAAMVRVAGGARLRSTMRLLLAERGE